MINTVENFLKKHELTDTQSTLLIGFSGGYDSLCLLDILWELSKTHKFNLVAMHLNHNWRGEESLQDEMNCKNYCKERKIEFISENINEDVPHNENAAREARYDFFVNTAKKYKNAVIMTAHTSTDNAETIIYRIIKGTGVKGLQGILPKRMIGSVPVYRPLLTLSRTQIEDYCNCKGLKPNCDSSNLDLSFKRNFIRHKVMPLFKEINFSAEVAINSLSELAISQSNIVEEYLKIILKDVYQDGKLISQNFKNLSLDLKRKIIYEACLKYNLDYDRKKVTNILEFINEYIDSKSGSRYSLTNNLWLFVNEKNIYLIDKVKAEKTQDEIQISKKGEWKFLGKTFLIKEFVKDGQFNFPKETEYIAYVDLSNIKGDLTIRTRKEGDIISPFGMQGKMKLKKFFNSKGISLHKRDEIILLCQKEEVLWAAGVGLSNKLRVVKEPTHVLELQ